MHGVWFESDLLLVMKRKGGEGEGSGEKCRFEDVLEGVLTHLACHFCDY